MAPAFQIEDPKTVSLTTNRSPITYRIASISSITCAALTICFTSSAPSLKISTFDTITNKISFIDCKSNDNRLNKVITYDFTIKTELLKKLDTLKESLELGWNGEADLPIEEKSYLNTRQALMATPPSMLKYWTLYPNTNGTLLLSPKDESVAGISIGNDDFSYAAYVSDDQQTSGKELFSEESFTAALRQLHRILGYA